MKYSGHRKLLSKLSKFNVFNLLGYQTNTDASILNYKFCPENWFRYVRRLYATAINFPCIITLRQNRSNKVNIIRSTQSGHNRSHKLEPIRTKQRTNPVLSVPTNQSGQLINTNTLHLGQIENKTGIFKSARMDR